MRHQTSTPPNRCEFFRRSARTCGSEAVIARGTCPSSSRSESGLSRIGASALHRPTPGVLRHPSPTSPGSAACRQALMCRVSDQDGAAAAGRLTTGRNSRGFLAKRRSGVAAMSGNGRDSHGPEHLRQPPAKLGPAMRMPGSGGHEHDQQSRMARRCFTWSIKSRRCDRKRCLFRALVVPTIHRHVREAIHVPRERSLTPVLRLQCCTA